MLISSLDGLIEYNHTASTSPGSSYPGVLPGILDREDLIFRAFATLSVPSNTCQSGHYDRKGRTTQGSPEVGTSARILQRLCQEKKSIS